MISVSIKQFLYFFQVHTRSATVRFMFFNRQDIDWFKPVELSSKYGRRGKKEHFQSDVFFFFLKVYCSRGTLSELGDGYAKERVLF